MSTRINGVAFWRHLRGAASSLIVTGGSTTGYVLNSLREKVQPGIFTSLALWLSLSIAIPAQTVAENWHQWRGPENNGVSRTATPPLEWSETKNVAWKIKIPGQGTASPIVYGDRIFVLTAVNTELVDPSLPKPEDQPDRVFGIKHPNTRYEMVVLCIDRKTGKQLWRDVAKTLVPHEGHHRDGSFASASPFCDGERLVCWFGSAGLFAYSLEGEKLWERDLGQAKVGASLGEGSSPVVHDGKIVLVRDHAGQSTITVLNAANGKTLWSKERDEPNAWATPAIAQHGGITQVITCASKQVCAYNLETGDIIWSAKGLTGNCTPCPIVDGDTVYCMSGYEGYALLAIPITGTGDVTDAIRWKLDRGTPYVPSPVLYDDRLYFTQSNQNILTAVDVTDGRKLFEKTRLPDVSGLYASPVAAAGRIYFAGRNGTTLVMEHGDTFKVQATNVLDDHFHASPALAGKQLLLRGLSSLYCLEAGASSETSAEDPLRAKLEAIARRPIPQDYPGGGPKHQPFVDREVVKLGPEQSRQLGPLWKAQLRLFPNMENKGNSFIRILDYLRSETKAEQPKRVEKKKPTAKKPSPLTTGRLSGRVTDLMGRPLGGIMVSAFQDERRQNSSVFTQTDGRFEITKLVDSPIRIRARCKGRVDQWIEDVVLGRDDLAIRMPMATGDELERQRPADSAFAQLPFESVRDKLNFKMMCSYCHQIGTEGFRTPEKPVDWETMIRRMDGFGGLYPHTQKDIVTRIIDTYKDDAVKKWPAYKPPLPPSGLAAAARITSWEMGEPFVGSFHDLEIGDDGLAYVVHIGKQYTGTLDPKTAAREYYKLPRGSHGPHSIELANDGHMWLTLCVSGEMAKFDLNSKEYTILSSAEPPAKRGSWPHTLRINPADPAGIIWYTDAGRNSVFSLHPKTMAVKEYHLLEAKQVKAGGKGESRGITPYGLDYSPVDGMIWYSKLNGNRIGRLDPKSPDGNITEWNPPFRGPRRLHVAPDGMVWVPGFGSGVFGRFDPKSETWTVYPLPDYQNQIPYALNVAPDGMVWICGTGNDTLYRFNPKTEVLVEFPLPFRASYTREIEFDAEGNVWTSTSGPARHMENVCGTIIRIELPDMPEAGVGGIKLRPIKLSPDEQGLLSEEERTAQVNKLGALLTQIEARSIPKAYQGKTHQLYVDRIMKTLPPAKRQEVNRLWKLRRAGGFVTTKPGESFVKILDYVATSSAKAVEPGRIHRLKNSPRRSPFDAFVYVNRLPEKPADENETAKQLAGRILGRLANQEGRVQIKLPPGMSRSAYQGFKTFLGSEGDAKISNCVECHRPQDFAVERIAGGPLESLRNLKRSPASLEKSLRSHTRVLKEKGDERMNISEADFPKLIAFLGSLHDVEEARFRSLILDARVTDVAAAVPASKSVLGGVVRFTGPRPKPVRLHMDEASRKLYEGEPPPVDQSLLVDAAGGLANVFLEIQSDIVKSEHALPLQPAVMDQRRSLFEPRVQGIRVGQALHMKNSDPFIHNIRSLSRKNRAFNIVQPPGTPKRTKTFETVEGPITIKCDFHRWMTAHFFIVDHPYFAVSDAAGKFHIEGLPDGTHQLKAWHENLGVQRATVMVKNGRGSVELTFSQP
ncbi:MAG: outer membrane protein assembly factor BamB [Kiritimatiellia bacterium]|jgi:outer membrane protein assembly factor BamB